jgi:hypothetical protein
MFVRQNQQQFRNSNADVQIFYGDTPAATASRYKKTWNKPPGVSHVYMMLIGAGGSGDGVTGGGSGAVTVWYGAAQNVPDVLEILAGFAINTTVSYRGSSLILLLTANAANTINGGLATADGVLAASGFYQSIAGQDGASISQGASGTTFLSGGAGGGGGVVANYGYNNAAANNGCFLLQPIIVGVGGGANATLRAGVGCGGGAASGTGGQGMVLIASW